MTVPMWMAALALLLTPVANGQSIHVVTETAATTVVANGEVSGPVAEIVKLSLKTAGLEHQVDILPWARAYQLALREPYTLIFPLARNAERESQFKWVVEIAKVNYYFVKRADRKDIVLKQLSDAKAYSVGVTRDDVRHHYLESQGFTSLVLSARWNDNLPRVLNGQIDLVVLADLDQGPACAGMALDCSQLTRALKLDALSTGLYAAYSLSTPDAVVQRTKAGFAKVKADGNLQRIVRGQPVRR